MSRAASEETAERPEAGSRPSAETIGRNVMLALGRPPDLHAVQVRRLWGNHYRVNVFTGPDPLSSRITSSFFVVIGEDGAVVRSFPEIVQKH